MTNETTAPEHVRARQKENYTIGGLDDELRADRLCTVLLRQFHRYLLEDCSLEPLEAGSLASGADYFLRDYMISAQRSNIFSASATSIRHFAGYWYIISTLEPNLSELSRLLKGADAFYHFCAAQELIAKHQATAITAACEELDYYQQRIESFHAITGDGFVAWEKNAP